MTGTSGAQYIEHAKFPAGVVGYRNLTKNTVRVRIETNAQLTLPGDWKEPEAGQQRYSIVVTKDRLVTALLIAVAALAEASCTNPGKGFVETFNEGFFANDFSQTDGDSEPEDEDDEEDEEEEEEEDEDNEPECTCSFCRPDLHWEKEDDDEDEEDEW